MRVAVVTETYPPEINGVAMTVNRFVTSLLKRKHQIQLIRPRQGGLDSAILGEELEEVLQAGVPIPFYNDLRMGLPAKNSLLKLWKSKKPDLVHIVTEGPLGKSALVVAKILSIPVSTSFHTNFHTYSQYYKIGIFRELIASYLRNFHNSADCTMVPTQQMRTDLEKHNYQNLVVIGRGVDTELFHPRRRSVVIRESWGVTDEQLAVLYVGRLAREKNLLVVIKTFEAIRAIRKNSKLIFVGDGPQKTKLEKTHPDFVFTGAKRGENLAEHYASADLFLFPSLTETYGNVTMEAMASGLPVIAYNYAAAAQHISHGENGLLAEFDNEGNFIGLACSLAVDQQLMSKLCIRARLTAEKISWSHVVDEFEKTLLDLTNIGGPVYAN